MPGLLILVKSNPELVLPEHPWSSPGKQPSSHFISAASLMVVEKGAQSLLDRDHPGKILLRNDSVPNGCPTRNVLLFRGFLPSPPFLGHASALLFSGKYCSMCQAGDRVFPGVGYFFDFIAPFR
jgi:hypothetical protein